MLRILYGLAAGAVGGIVQGLIRMPASALLGYGFFWPFANIGRAFMPETRHPSQREPRIIARGMGLHLIASMLLALPFSLVAPRLPRVVPVWAWGVLHGALIWVVDMLGLLRLLDPTMNAIYDKRLFLFTHLVYGGAMGWWLQELPPEAAGPRPSPARSTRQVRRGVAGLWPLLPALLLSLAGLLWGTGVKIERRQTDSLPY